MRTIRRLAFAGALGALVVGLVPVLGASGAPPALRTSPVALTFLSASRGWALGEAACGSGSSCPTLSSTSDGGRTWATRRLPTGVGELAGVHVGVGRFGVLGIDFADPEDGWIYGWAPASNRAGAVSALWSTHDGGRDWARVDLARMGVQTQLLALSAADGRVYLIGGRLSERYGVWSSPVGRDAWSRVAGVTMSPAAGGGEMTGAVVLYGSVGWALVGNDRGVTGFERLAADGRWSPTADPCAEVGDSYAVPVALSATTLEDVCTIGGFGSYAKRPPKGAVLGSQWLYVSHDGGASFAPVRPLDLAGYQSYLLTADGLPAFPSAGTILIATHALHDTVGIPVLIESRDDGARWAVAYRGAGEGSFAQVEFPSARAGFAIVESRDASSLIRSTDGGRSWASVTL